MNYYNKNNLKIGDTVLVEQAWEDETGIYHDEFAEITKVSSKGELKLRFIGVAPEVKGYLAKYEYFANDYHKEG